jgi:hypothetical protein
MRGHPFLNPIEAIIIRWIVRSPRIGAIIVKERGSPVTWTISDPSDCWAVAVEDEDIPEPASMQLERLYHLPDADR